jgi:hypothetical protein
MMRRLKVLFKAVRELGVTKLWHYACYRIGLISGHYRRLTPPRRSNYSGAPGLPPYAQFPEVSQAQRDFTLSIADEICGGEIRLFGGNPVPLNLNTGASDEHWTTLVKSPPAEDIKFIWEPGRFSWAITLARAYAFSGNSTYAQEFWDKTLYFLDAHPPNFGRQWQSAQEVAIRLMALVFCDRVLASASSSTQDNRIRLWQVVAEHAQRIPPTLVYARAQNNNHLLSEAAGLFTAGLYLPDHPQAEQWRSLGWHWLNWGFQEQIDEFGTYVQHSVNYHRLMLQLALFTDHLRRERNGLDWPSATVERLAAATRWLWALTDPDTGRTPNLGADDGAYVFPLTSLPHDDFRPVVDAAAKAFLYEDIYNQSNLAEMADWFDLQAKVNPHPAQPQASDMLRIDNAEGRAFIHAAYFTDRPSHADQLHVDLWWRGVNIACDPGTYQYNTPPPWDNALASTRVHNTLTLDGQDQMLRAGRFLWLDWAQAEVLAYEVDDEGQLSWVTAEHNGFKSLDALHQRTLSASDKGWTVTDRIMPYGKAKGGNHEVRLSWLLPDWDWRAEAKNVLRLKGQGLNFSLEIIGVEGIHLFRAGENVYGEMQAQSTWGWRAPTYGKKVPALQVVALLSGKPPMKIESVWRFED